jgi:hypothetical protein
MLYTILHSALLLFIQLQVPEIPVFFGTTIYFIKKSFITRKLKVNGLLPLKLCSDNKIIWPHIFFNLGAYASLDFVYI